MLNDIPLVIVRSGEATLAGAYEVTGDELASYLEKAFERGGLGDEPSTWRKQPTKVVDMSIFDGDMTTMTPGPPEADRSAVRVLVVIVDGDAQLWMTTGKDRSVIPRRARPRLTNPCIVAGSATVYAIASSVRAKASGITIRGVGVGCSIPLAPTKLTEIEF